MAGIGRLRSSHYSTATGTSRVSYQSISLAGVLARLEEMEGRRSAAESSFAASLNRMQEDLHVLLFRFRPNNDSNTVAGDSKNDNSNNTNNNSNDSSSIVATNTNANRKSNCRASSASLNPESALAQNPPKSSVRLDVSDEPVEWPTTPRSAARGSRRDASMCSTGRSVSLSRQPTRQQSFAECKGDDENQCDNWFFSIAASSGTSVGDDLNSNDSSAGAASKTSQWLQSHKERFEELTRFRSNNPTLIMSASSRNALPQLDKYEDDVLITTAESHAYQRRWRCFSRSPTHPSNVAFKLLGTLLLFVDLTATPVLLAWDTGDDWSLWSSGISAVFWSIDMLTSLYVGYYVDGKLIVDNKKIFAVYMRKWFFPDLAVLAIDWWNFLIGLSGTHGSHSRKLRQFLWQNDVDAKLTRAVMQQTLFRWGQAIRLEEKDVLALESLSTTLRSELRFAIMGKSLLTNPFFLYVKSLDPFWCKRILVSTLSVVSVNEQDDLFLPNDLATHTFCLQRGNMTYYQDPSTAIVPAATMHDVEPGSWISEPALWVVWYHVGRAEVEHRSELLTLEVETFMKVVLPQSNVSSFVKAFARQWYRNFLHSGPPAFDWPSDINPSTTCWSDVVFSMDSVWRKEISLQALSRTQLNNWRSFLGNWKQKLLKEIETGRTVIVVQGDGVVERLVEVITFHVTHSQDGCSLVMLGAFDGEIVAQASCLRPGGKRVIGETVAKATNRLLETKFDWLAAKARFANQQCRIEKMRKDDPGLSTCYTRIIWHAEMVEDLDVPTATMGRPFGSIRKSLVQQVTIGSRPQVPPWMSFRPVHFVQNGLNLSGNYYAWLTDEEIASVQTANGQKDLMVWLSSLGRPPIERDATMSTWGRSFKETDSEEVARMTTFVQQLDMSIPVSEGYREAEPESYLAI